VIELHRGDCLDILPKLPDDSVDAVVTDPPAGIGFMGKGWDGDKGGRREWVGWLSAVLGECLRVARPGSVLLCWAIPRTSHWTGCAIEDAGWQIEDRIAHHFGSGFPKHKSKLKPATEDWWLARKPGPKWLGVGACRARTGDDTARANNGTAPGLMNDDAWRPKAMATGGDPAGRWPANLLLSHSPGCNGTCNDDCPIRLMGEQGGKRSSRPGRNPGGVRQVYGDGWTPKSPRDYVDPSDTGTAARFFPNFDADPFLYCPKASRSERNRGCEGMAPKGTAERPGRNQCVNGVKLGGSGKPVNGDGKDRPSANHHPTVKPEALMRWLCRLATPPGGIVLDPFMGSGSTGVAAIREGFGFVGAERDPEYFAVAERRIAAAEGVAMGA
jgi:site-specific DNA-methyltransferase (adenine-specific)